MMSEGNYYGTIKKAVTSQSKNGKPQICITFDVTHFANGGDWEPLSSNQERTVFLFLTDAAWEYTEKKLMGLGFNGDFDDPQFTEQNATLECTVELYEGKEREKWDISGGGYEPERAPTDVIRTLNAKWRSRAGTPATTPKPNGRPESPQRERPAHSSSGALGAAMNDDSFDGIPV